MRKDFGKIHETEREGGNKKHNTGCSSEFDNREYVVCHSGLDAPAAVGPLRGSERDDPDPVARRELDYGVCDACHFSGSDRTAYVLRTDWNEWAPGTVCYEIYVVINPNRGDAPSGRSYGSYGNISTWVTMGAVMKLTFLPPYKKTEVLSGQPAL